MQGKMIGEYLVKNYDRADLNGDGKISYVMFKGQEGNLEAIARTKYSVEDANKVLKEAGKPELVFMIRQTKTNILSIKTDFGHLLRQQIIWAPRLRNIPKPTKI